MTRDGPRPGRAETLPAVAFACALVVVWLVLETVEPEAADGLPAIGGVAWWTVLIVLVAQATALAWRLRSPGRVGVLVAAAIPLAAATGIGPAIGLTSFVLFFAAYTLVTSRALPSVGPVLVLMGVLVAVGHGLVAVRSGETLAAAALTGLAQAVVLVGAPVGVAALVLVRRESRSAREDRLTALEREHAALVQVAVARERTAMARELHDIAAHHLTGIALMSAAVVAQIDTDPEGAKTAVAGVRRQSTAVLRDLRRLVGLLREHDGAAPDGDVRTESLAGVPALVSQVASAGQDVALTTLAALDGSPLGSGIGPLAQLAAYRTVQEALANAARHAAGARCQVELDDRDPGALVVTVRNAPGTETSDPGSRGGLGLVGMRERAELTGSQLDVGPAPGGGWCVRLRTPRPDSVGPEEPT